MSLATKHLRISTYIDKTRSTTALPTKPPEIKRQRGLFDDSDSEDKEADPNAPVEDITCFIDGRDTRQSGKIYLRNGQPYIYHYRHANHARDRLVAKYKELGLGTDSDTDSDATPDEGSDSEYIHSAVVHDHLPRDKYIVNGRDTRVSGNIYVDFLHHPYIYYRTGRRFNTRQYVMHAVTDI